MKSPRPVRFAHADGDNGDFGAGTFDIELVAYKDGVELVGTAVRVEVQEFVN